jgi:hypothetical protein
MVIAMSWTVFSGSNCPSRLGIQSETPYRWNFGQVKLNWLLYQHLIASPTTRPSQLRPGFLSS